jgi:hypothetical protein
MFGRAAVAVKNPQRNPAFHQLGSKAKSRNPTANNGDLWLNHALSPELVKMMHRPMTLPDAKLVGGLDCAMKPLVRCAYGLIKRHIFSKTRGNRR